MRTKVVNVLGDVCLTDDNRQFAERRDGSGLFNGVLDVLRQADLNIANLESRRRSLEAAKSRW